MRQGSAGIVTVILIFSFGIGSNLAIHQKAAKRFPRFSPDSVNYLSTARNIIAGKGIATSIGGPRSDSFPVPLTIQPPGYPLAIAAFTCLGFHPETAATLVPLAAHLVTLILCGFLGYRRGGRWGLVVAVVAYSTFWPLAFVSVYAWSESVFILFMLLSLLAAQEAASLEARPRKRTWLLALGGIAAGLAFGTRYVGVVCAILYPALLFALGPVLRERGGRGKAIKGILVSGSLFVALAFPVLLRNHAITGSWGGGNRETSSIGIGRNVEAALESVSSGMLPDFPFAGMTFYRWHFCPYGKALPGLALLLLLTVLAVLRSVRSKTARYILPLVVGWTYLILICILRSISNFDQIDTRLMAPLCAALLYSLIEQSAEVIGSRPFSSGRFAVALIGLTLFISGQAHALTDMALQEHAGPWPAEEEARWIEGHTEDGDVVLSNGAIWLAKRLPSRFFVSLHKANSASASDLRRMAAKPGARYLVLFKPEVLLDPERYRWMPQQAALRAALAKGYVDVQFDPLPGQPVIENAILGEYLDELFVRRGSPEAKLVVELERSLIFSIAPNPPTP